MNADLARPQPGALSYRAGAVLVALRLTSRGTTQICYAIADDSIESTRALLRDLEREALIVKHANGWYLTESGVAWLETNGMTVADGARS